MSSFKPSTGNPIRALPVSAEKLMAVTSLAELQNAGFRDPAELESLKKQEIKADPKVGKAKEVRALVQRRFDSKRKARAAAYSIYIERCYAGEISGDTPPINIWVPAAGGYDAENAALVIPYGTHLIAIDGETQSHARFLLADRKPETMNLPIAVVFHNGITAEEAKQRLYDFNHYAHPVKAAQLSTFNAAGPLSHATNQALDMAGLDRALIEPTAKTPAKRGRTIISFLQGQHAVIGAELGETAFNASPATLIEQLNTPTGTAQINGIGKKFLSTLVRDLAEHNERLINVAPEVLLVAGALQRAGRTLDAGKIAIVRVAYDRASKQKLPVKERLRTAFADAQNMGV
jgi:hypothetical protein